MSSRSRLFLPVILSAIAVFAGCGSSTHATPPPGGGFSNSNLNGSYVFSVAGTDGNGFPYAIVGDFTANGMGGNGTGGVSTGTLDINDAGSTSPNLSIGNGSSYTVGVDGRGEAHLVTSLGTVVLDFVLQDSSHGLVIEFDGSSGSGTLDVQTASTTPNGSYAFSFSGANATGAFATVGNFTLSSSSIASGLEDFNNAGSAFSGTGNVGNSLSGTVVAGPSSSPGTTLITSAFGTLTFDVYPVNANHLKFIEMDAVGTLSGDAFSQTSTSMPTGALAFTLGGFLGVLTTNTPFAAGGFMVTDSQGNITNLSTEDFNAGGVTISSTPSQFSGLYTASPSAGSGRFLLNNFSSFQGGTQYVAYPSSGGLLLLESDGTGSIETGAASAPQSSTTLASAQGYGLNFTGINVAVGVEVDDIAEFVTSSTQCGSATGLVVKGLIDENFDPGGSPLGNQTLCGNYTAPDSNGRGQVGTVSGNNTLNGGFLLTFYSVDGTTFPFIESDNGQVSTGVFVQQNASASSSAAAKVHMFTPPPILRAHMARKN